MRIESNWLGGGIHGCKLSGLVRDGLGTIRAGRCRARIDPGAGFIRRRGTCAGAHHAGASRRRVEGVDRTGAGGRRDIRKHGQHLRFRTESEVEAQKLGWGRVVPGGLGVEGTRSTQIAGYASSLSLSRAITLKSSSVVMSPLTSPLVASSRSRRRMILPLRVLGSMSVKRMSSGLAIAPISLATHFLSSSLSSGVGFRPCSKLTKAEMA